MNRNNLKPIIFIIPLKSKKTSNNWNLVVNLLESTLSSILNQSAINFLIYIVCNKNQAPKLNLEDERIIIIEDEFKIPDTRAEIFLDQKLKIKRGLIETSKFSEHFFIRMDADDLIHKDLIEFINKNKSKQGWVIPNGYMYERNSKYIYLRHNFNFTCATSHIVKLYEDDFPEKMDTPDDQYLVDFWQHLKIENTLRLKNRKLEKLPFRGAVYTIGHQESVMLHKMSNFHGIRRYIWKLMSKRRLNSSIRENFNIN